MTEITHKGMTFRCAEDIPEEEAVQYIERAIEKFKTSPTGIRAEIPEDDGFIDLYYEWNCYVPKFQRLRRITGYLVGTLDRWNDAKAAEERERIKHRVGRQL